MDWMLTDVPLLDGRLRWRDALDRLAAVEDDAMVAIRRRRGLVVLWYVFRVSEVRAAPYAHDDAPLEDALDLHERDSSPMTSADEVAPDDDPPPAPTVVLDGTELAGVAIPQATAGGARPDRADWVDGAWPIEPPEATRPDDDEMLEARRRTPESWREAAREVLESAEPDEPRDVRGDEPQRDSGALDETLDVTPAGEDADLDLDDVWLDEPMYEEMEPDDREGTGDISAPDDEADEPDEPASETTTDDAPAPAPPARRSARERLERVRAPRVDVPYEVPAHESSRELEETAPEPAMSTFSAMPRLDAPDRVEPLAPFELVVSFGATSSAGTFATPVTVRVPRAQESIELEVLVQAAHCSAPEGWRHRVVVERANTAAARLRVPLVADALPDDDDVLLTQISVIFTHRGLTCGMATRRLAIVAADAQPFDDTSWGGTRWTDQDGASASVRVDARDAAPDLTIFITRPTGDPTSGTLLWSMTSPHRVTLPAKAIPHDLGDDTETFAKSIIDDVVLYDRTDLADDQLRSVGQDVADAIPAPVWTAFRAVADRVAIGAGRPCTVLIQTAEPHVPWELALVDPPLDSTRPPFLGAQACVGRWIAQSPGIGQPPAAEISVSRIAVMAGRYDPLESRRAALTHAEQECADLSDRLGAIKLEARLEDVAKMLDAALAHPDGPGGVEAMHIACHGESDPTRPPESAIILQDGRPLRSRLFRRCRLGTECRPFAFINACEVGTSGRMLNTFRGFAGDLLRGGFRGFVAPLWRVRDETAREVSLEFYRRTLGATPPDPVAAVLRDVRGRFTGADDQGRQATWMAYVFYGHPALLLSRAQTGVPMTVAEETEP